MLKSNAKWVYPTKEAVDEFEAAASLQLPPVIKELLAQRGIKNADAANRFLYPQLSQLYASFWFESMKEAVSRVNQAIKNEEKILIFGDYDADGISSTTLMLDVLSSLGATCDYYIPNRFTEGYGPNEQAFQWAVDAGFSLVITVDTGIAAHSEIHYANELGLDVIVTDHHEIQQEGPDAFAIIHPDLSPDYPFKDLAGVGVAFKFAEALLDEFPEHLLDLVALGTIADMVPLLGENRILAAFGLQHLSNTKRPGLKALKAVHSIDDPVSEEAVAFKLAPAINAVGRLQDADLAIALLTAPDEQTAKDLAQEVKLLNEKRKSIVSAIVSEAEKMVDPNERDVIVVADANWNPGVLGIVASNLVRKFNRPAIVLALDEEEGSAKGSARSIPAFDLFKNGMAMRNLFTHFGGHAQAAGMTLPVENIETLRSQLRENIQVQLSPEDFQPVIHISDAIGTEEMDHKLVNELSRLAPFGMGNPKPIFHVKTVPADIRQIGNNRDHLKMQLQGLNQRIDAIGFGMGREFWHIAPKTPVSIVGELGINEWNGHKKIQIVMRDISVDDWQLFDHRGRNTDKLLDLFTDTSTVAVVGQNKFEHANIDRILYNEARNTALDPIETLILSDLPSDLDELAEIISKTDPQQIHVCFNIENSQYLKPFPSRADFKWFYGLIVKQSVINLHQELQKIMAVKSWSKDFVIFMAQVFWELDFIDIDKGIIRKNPNPSKKDLDQSVTYKSHVRRRDIEQVLYYSQYDQLKAWFDQCMNETRSAAREAVTDGL